MKIANWPIDKPIPYARNPRINAESIDTVAASIKEFGFRQPIVVDDDGVILVGHTRLKAAHKLGMEAVPVHVASGLTESQRKAYRIMDNRASHASEWDVEMLALEICDLDADRFDLDLTGFDAESLDELLSDVDDLGGNEGGAEGDASGYTTKIEIPIYEPKNKKPTIQDLIDIDKTKKILANIDASDVPELEKEFLRAAAERHTVFKFAKIADYYAHSDGAMQRLMEESALVIIDYDKAIEYGFVHMSEAIGELVSNEN